MDNVDLDLHHEDKNGMLEGRGLYNHTYYTNEYQEQGEKEYVHLPRN